MTSKRFVATYPLRVSLKRRVSVVLVLVLTSTFAVAETPPQGNFSDYVMALRLDAERTHGIRQETLNNAFSTIKPFRTASGVKDAPVTVKNLEAHLAGTLSEALVDEAKLQYKNHSELLTRFGETYGVQPRFIVALWGLESVYGKETGNFPVLSVTASKAFDGQNEAFFREQFFAALKLIDSNGVSLENLRSDNHGRLGQLKLLPVGFLEYAKDGDDDGTIDIWSNPADVFASIASFLKQSGWKDDETWGRQVKIPQDFDTSLAKGNTHKSFSDWQALGVRRYDGGDLPSRADMHVAMVMPDGPKGRVFLVYDNYAAIKRWRDDDYFALAMVHLSDRIKFQFDK